MTPRRVRVGVVGVGHLGRHHARLYAAAADTELVAVADRDLDRARAIAAEYGCEAFSDAGALAGRIDAASVATPTVDHREVAEILLAGGADVLIEKPIAPALADADAILAAATRAGRLVMVGHTERFNPAMVALARAVDAPRFVEIHRLAGFTARSTDVDVILDLMIHDLDLLLWFDGTDPATVDAVGVAALTDKLDIANARIRFASGCVANVTASRISAEALRRIRVFQSRTYIACDTGERKVERFRLVFGPDRKPAIQRDLLPVDATEPLAAELAAFAEAVRTRTPPAIDGLAGRRALELALRVRDAIAGSGTA
ncbi:MAG TPA: Gfo/Idh/MocA family oxidoreductase [Candidatus Polarisedimenticolaceae bacterium]|nr:Gfo/Idh/MocA family oxidoreductase [Candidatus Polarisedimenticolaceae bacterium]